MLLPLTKTFRGEINYALSGIGTVGKCEVITCRFSTIWCFLSGLQNIQYKVDTSSFGYLHIPWNLSIATSINEVQATASGQGI